MADIPGASVPMNDIEIGKRIPTTQSVFTKIAANINDHIARLSSIDALVSGGVGNLSATIINQTVTGDFGPQYTMFDPGIASPSGKEIYGFFITELRTTASGGTALNETWVEYSAMPGNGFFTTKANANTTVTQTGFGSTATTKQISTAIIQGHSTSFVSQTQGFNGDNYAITTSVGGSGNSRITFGVKYHGAGSTGTNGLTIKGLMIYRS